MSTMQMWLAIAATTLPVVAFACVRLWMSQRWPLDLDPVVEAIDAVLPQTQCAQCNYPGCRPYAEAIVHNNAPTNLCPPGGPQVHAQLLVLSGRSEQDTPPEPAAHALALIDPDACIGCGLCLPPCPVDAIAGAPGFLHTVITDECTGCELCIDPCPVDCITLVPLAEGQTPPQQKNKPAPHAGCINCNLCEPVCPVDLPPRELLRVLDQADLQGAAALSVSTCIECGLCNKSCPSDINLSGTFAWAKAQLQQSADEQAQQDRLKARFHAHETRLAARATATARSKRLAGRGKRSWQASS